MTAVATTRFRRHVALAAAAAAGAALLAATPAEAYYPKAAPGVLVESLPYTASYDVFTDDVGLPGSDTVNRRVADECNAGDPIWTPQWFQLPQADVGRVQFQVRAVNLARGVVEIPSGAAVVSTWNGTVVSCGGGVLTPTAVGEGLSVVAWFGGGHDVEDCDRAEISCTANRLQLSLDPTSGIAPANDALPDATVIPALPFQATADTTLATADGPLLADYPNCLASSIDPVELRTVWWRYTPATTHVLSVSATSDRDTPVLAGVAVVTPSGPVRAPRLDEGSDPFDCDSPIVAQAGRSYLIGVVVPHDRYGGEELPRGSRVDLRVGAVPAPGMPERVHADVDGRARSATLSWLPPRSGGTSPVTGYRVWRDGTDSGGTGPWSTTLPADARSLTFTYLNPWDPYRLSVQAINASGPGTPVARAVAAQGPATGPVTHLRVRAGFASATLSWDVPRLDGTGPIVGWRVRRFDGASWRVQSSVMLPPDVGWTWTATGLTAGREYSFEVVAVSGDGVGAGRWARTPVIVPGSGATAAPAITSADVDEAARSITLAWAPPADTGGLPVTGYRVARDGFDRGGTGPGWSATLPPAPRSVTFRYLTAAAPYTLTVRAVTSAGTGAAASVTRLLTWPDSPNDTHAEAVPGGAAVSWAAPYHEGTSPVTGYRVRRLSGDGRTVLETRTVAAPARDTAWAGLPRVPVRFDVIAVSALGPSPASYRSEAVTPR